MTKEVSSQFNILGSTSVTGATTLTSSVSGIIYRDSIYYHVNYSGAPVGTFNVQVSGDYSPGGPQGPQGSGGPRAGNWTTLVASSVSAASSSPIIFDITPTSLPWSRIQFVGATSSGVLDVWTGAKSYG